jgi:hypothetical protein
MYRFTDPARFSFAHGGKYRHPFPLPIKVYDETVKVLKSAVQKAKLGREEELRALQRLDEQARRLERHAGGPSVEEIIHDELRHSHSYGGRSVFGLEPAPETPARNRAQCISDEPGRMMDWESAQIHRESERQDGRQGPLDVGTRMCGMWRWWESASVQPLFSDQGTAGDPRTGRRHEQRDGQLAATPWHIPGLPGPHCPQPAGRPGTFDGALGYAVTRGRTETLKIKYTDFQQSTRSVSLPGVIEERTALERIALDLLKAQFPVAKGIRLLGISISSFTPADVCDAGQLPLGI